MLAQLLMFFVILWCATAVFAAASEPGQNALTPEAHAAGWRLLFNGENLDGFATEGDIDAWGVVDGEIRILRPGRGWWLRTERMFRDFELEVEFIVPEDGNSGVGLRGTSQGDPAFTGFELQILGDRGEAPSVTSCGAVYNAIPPRENALNAPGEWNAYRVRLVGDTLDVWLNDVPIHRNAKLDRRGFFRTPDQSRPLGERATTGYIAFQDHGEGGLRLRNIRVRDLSPDPDPGDFMQAFNGRDLAGWHALGGGQWTVEEGALVGAGGPGHLFSDSIHTDIEIRALVRVNERGNSGLFVRAAPGPGEPGVAPVGYELQVDNHDPKNFTGCVYDRARPEAGGPITRDGAWFDCRIVAVGDRVRTWINGVPMADARLAEFDKGRIALQTHHEGSRVEFKDIRIRVPYSD